MSIDDWRAAVEKGLKGKPFEKLTRTGPDGVRREPLYVEAPRVAVRAKRSAGWTIAQAYTNPSAEGAAAEIRADLAAGVEAVVLLVDYAARLDLDVTSPQARPLVGKHGVAIHADEDADAIAGSLGESSAPVFVDAGANGAVVAERIARAARPTTTVFPCMDPLGALVSDGVLPRPVDALLEEAARYQAAHPSGAAWLASGVPYHEGGASLTLELAAIVATFVEYVRRGAAPGAVLLALSAEADVPMGVAKTRALRVLIEKAKAALGSADPRAPFLVGVTSLRHATRRDPESNILRATSETFALAVGGADLVIARPHDAALGGPGALARRISKNVQLVLREEGHVGRVVDPLAGSFAVESMTDAIARASWAILREIEADGGIEDAIRSGSIQRRVREGWEKEQRDVGRRAKTIVGVNAFAPLARPGIARDVAALWPDRDARREAVASAIVERAGGSVATDRASGAPFGGPIAVRLDHVRDAGRFESLRSEADDLAEQAGRPRVAVIVVGSQSDTRARVDFVARFFELGGFDVTIPSADATAAVDADVVALAATDATYVERGAELLASVRAANPRALVVLAGKAGALAPALAAVAPSVDVFVGCDAVGVLATALHHVRQSR